jgi:hypothetical protein
MHISPRRDRAGIGRHRRRDRGITAALGRNAGLLIGCLTGSMAVAAPVAAAPLVVVRRADSLPGRCLASEQVRAAVEARLPGASGSPWTLGYTDGATALDLELRDPQGAVRLQRRLPLASGCAGAADAVAIVLERYFRDIGWNAGAPPATVSRPGGPQAHPPPGSGLREEPATLPRLSLSVGPALWRSYDWALRVGADVRVRVAGPVEVSAAVLLPGHTLSEPLDDPAQRAQTAGVPLRAAVHAATLVGRTELRGGPELLFMRESARTQGIAVTGSAGRSMFGLGLGLATAAPLARGFRLVAQVAVYRTWGGELTVTRAGEERAVLPLPGWQGILSLGVGYALLR